MDLNVLAIGRKMPGWIAQGWQEYARRMPPHLKLNLIELDAAQAGNAAEISSAEAAALQKRMPQPAWTIALDGRGRQWSTEQLAAQLENWQMSGQAVNFLIGGANGLDDSIRTQADQCWSLGALTLPHMLVRVVLAEQLYRAWMVTAGHPYHRA